MSVIYEYNYSLRNVRSSRSHQSLKLKLEHLDNAYLFEMMDFNEILKIKFDIAENKLLIA